MTKTYTTEQRKAAIKINQLIEIARDIAAENGLHYFEQELSTLSGDIRQTHRHEAKNVMNDAIGWHEGMRDILSRAGNK